MTQNDLSKYEAARPTKVVEGVHTGKAERTDRLIGKAVKASILALGIGGPVLVGGAWGADGSDTGPTRLTPAEERVIDAADNPAIPTTIVQEGENPTSIAQNLTGNSDPAHPEVIDLANDIGRTYNNDKGYLPVGQSIDPSKLGSGNPNQPLSPEEAAQRQ